MLLQLVLLLRSPHTDGHRHPCPPTVWQHWVYGRRPHAIAILLDQWVRLLHFSLNQRLDSIASIHTLASSKVDWAAELGWTRTSNSIQNLLNPISLATQVSRWTSIVPAVAYVMLLFRRILLCCIIVCLDECVLTYCLCVFCQLDPVEAVLFLHAYISECKAMGVAC